MDLLVLGYIILDECVGSIALEMGINKHSYHTYVRSVWYHYASWWYQDIEESPYALNKIPLS